jgi:hypothetical protein
VSQAACLEVWSRTLPPPSAAAVCPRPPHLFLSSSPALASDQEAPAPLFPRLEVAANLLDDTKVPSAWTMAGAGVFLLRLFPILIDVGTDVVRVLWQWELEGKPQVLGGYDGSGVDGRKEKWATGLGCAGQDHEVCGGQETSFKCERNLLALPVGCQKKTNSSSRPAKCGSPIGPKIIPSILEPTPVPGDR